jgi:sporulation integral membrane protein YtvI
MNTGRGIVLEELDPVSRQVLLRRYLRRLAEIAILSVFLVVLTFVFLRTLTYTLPFVIAVFIAILLNPVVNALVRRGIPRPAAVIFTMVLVLGVLLALLIYMIVALVQEAAILSQQLPQLVAEGQAWVLQEVTRARAILPPTAILAIQQGSVSVLNSLTNSARAALGDLLQGLAGLPEGVVIVVIALVASYFFLADRDAIFQKFKSILPPTWDSKVDDVVWDVNRAFAGLIRAQGILVILSTVLGMAGLLLMKVPYAMIMGTVIGISGLIPIIGSGIVTVPWALLAFVTGDPILSLKVLVLQGIISLIRHMIEPKILAQTMGLNTLATLIALYIGYKAMGVLGLFVGPIIVIAILSLIRARMFSDFLYVGSRVPAADEEGTEES